ncbi:hypothetical protein TNIN_117321 [Trichonephila inaurata madagascariensis]|uniref:Uncharacterized protein n=1 Tax=Trichonephila inaurata madagascariensis TaxID=2747483 RepID=A0A8X6I8W6_9ARAC|nr:hypothetical protein TNIN_117321 [Trichonephila inaurata madagascariensis]
MSPAPKISHQNFGTATTCSNTSGIRHENCLPQNGSKVKFNRLANDRQPKRVIPLLPNGKAKAPHAELAESFITHLANDFVQSATLGMLRKVCHSSNCFVNH